MVQQVNDKAMKGVKGLRQWLLQGGTIIQPEYQQRFGISKLSQRISEMINKEGWIFEKTPCQVNESQTFTRYRLLSNGKQTIDELNGQLTLF